jgi:hypothetical protein
MTRNTAGKYVYSTGLHLFTLGRTGHTSWLEDLQVTRSSSGLVCAEKCSLMKHTQEACTEEVPVSVRLICQPANMNMG